MIDERESISVDLRRNFQNFENVRIEIARII